VRTYKVDLPGVQVDFHALGGSHYDRAADFLWHAENSYFANPSRYVSQLDLFHEELLYPILVDKMRWKGTDHELARVDLGDRIEYLAKNKKELAAFGSALVECHRLRCSCPESHTRLHKELTATAPVDWRQRDGLKKRLVAAYQELTEWFVTGCP
jgi:hypothetical protein